jgi:hypothetical protein
MVAIGKASGHTAELEDIGVNVAALHGPAIEFMLNASLPPSVALAMRLRVVP